MCCAGCLQAKFTDIPVTDEHRVEAKASVQYKVMSYTVCSGHCTLCTCTCISCVVSWVKVPPKAAHFHQGSSFSLSIMWYCLLLLTPSLVPRLSPLRARELLRAITFELPVQRSSLTIIARAQRGEPGDKAN